MKRAFFPALVSAALSAGCEKHLDDRECALLLEHYVALLMHDENPDADPSLVAQKQSEAKRLVEKDSRFEFDRCSAKVHRTQYECALAAPTVDAVEQCLLF